MIRNKKAQSMLEYIIVLAALVVVIASFAVKKIKPAVEKGINNAGSAIETAADKL